MNIAPPSTFLWEEKALKCFQRLWSHTCPSLVWALQTSPSPSWDALSGRASSPLADHTTGHFFVQWPSRITAWKWPRSAIGESHQSYTPTHSKLHEGEIQSCAFPSYRRANTSDTGSRCSFLRTAPCGTESYASAHTCRHKLPRPAFKLTICTNDLCSNSGHFSDAAFPFKKSRK